MFIECGCFVRTNAQFVRCAVIRDLYVRLVVALNAILYDETPNMRFRTSHTYTRASQRQRQRDQNVWVDNTSMLFLSNTQQTNSQQHTHNSHKFCVCASVYELDESSPRTKQSNKHHHHHHYRHHGYRFIAVAASNHTRYHADVIDA